MRLNAGLVFTILILACHSINAAPIPKDLEKPPALIGTWKFVWDSRGPIGQGYTFTMTYRKDGEVVFHYEYLNNAVANQNYFGTYKILNNNTYEYSVDMKTRIHAEKLIIDSITKTKLEVTDPVGVKQGFERVETKK